MAAIAIVAICAASIALMLVRPRGWPEAVWVGAGAALLVAFGLVSPPAAWRAVRDGEDVYLFLIAMMLICGLARVHGVFDHLAATAVAAARGSRARLFTGVYAVGIVVTALMSNDATAVVLTPAILAAVRAARVPALPYLFACALIANAASFLLPISNPANIVVFHDGGAPALAAWLGMFALPSAAAIVATYLVLRWRFRGELVGTIDGELLPSEPLSRAGRFVVIGLLVVVATMLVASAVGRDLGLPASLAAIAITAITSAATRTDPRRYARDISWTTLALVAALFVLVAAASSIGVAEVTADALVGADHANAAAGVFASGAAVAIANNVVNNLPLGLIASAALHASHAGTLVTSSVLIGVDLGPNLSITGSLATILWLLALRREGVAVGFWQFLRVGALAMPVALVAALAALLAMRG